MVAEARSDKVLDCGDQVCPDPVIRAKQEMDKLLAGQVLEIRTIDPGAESDIQSWTKWTGHKLLGQERQGGVLRFLVRKGVVPTR